jgi:hypothetical protein
MPGESHFSVSTTNSRCTALQGWEQSVPGPDPKKTRDQLYDQAPTVGQMGGEKFAPSEVGSQRSIDLQREARPGFRGNAPSQQRSAQPVLITASTRGLRREQQLARNSERCVFDNSPQSWIPNQHVGSRQQSITGFREGQRMDGAPDRRSQAYDKPPAPTTSRRLPSPSLRPFIHPDDRTAAETAAMYRQDRERSLRETEGRIDYLEQQRVQPMASHSNMSHTSDQSTSGRGPSLGETYMASAGLDGGFSIAPARPSITSEARPRVDLDSIQSSPISYSSISQVGIKTPLLRSRLTDRD